MISVMLDDGETEIFLTEVDHFTTAHDAAQALWESIHARAKEYGGNVFLFSPEDRGKPGWAVVWRNGPKQWADAYVVAEGADAPGFVASAEKGHSVVFEDLS